MNRTVVARTLRGVALAIFATLIVTLSLATPASAKPDPVAPRDASAPEAKARGEQQPPPPKATQKDNATEPRQSGPDGRIVGGTPASVGEYPYFVSVQTSGGSHFCGGSLLSSTRVLTAAHCVDGGTTPASLRVVIGRTTLNDANQGIIRNLSGIAVHPNWNPSTFQNDVAILTLSTAVTNADNSSRGIEWLRLAETSESGLYDPGDPATVIGHGHTTEGGTASNALLEVSVPVQSDATMSSAYGSGFDPATMVGAGPVGGGQDSCQGDSGGPLLVPTSPINIQIGDVSWGNGCARPDFPGIYGELYQGSLRTFVNGQVFRPVNDRFSGATPLGGNSGAVSGTLVDATTEPGETALHETSVWYSWTPSESGPARITANDHDFDSTVRVFTGASVSGLTQVAENDDFNGTLESTVNFTATAGTTYRIAVDGFAYSFGSFRLSYAVNPPANDQFAAPTTLSGSQGYVFDSNVRATGEAGEPFYVTSPDSSVWYSWTAPVSGTAVFTTADSNFDTVLTAVTGTSITSLTTKASNDDTNNLQSFISFPATAGTNYRITVDGFGGGSRGDIRLHWDVNPPANDRFASAQAISGSSGSVAGSTTGAVGEPGEPAHHGGANNGSVWYRWTAPVTGTATFLADSGGATDHVMAAYTGTFVTSLASQASDDDFGPGLDPLISFPVTAGGVYSIAVDPYSTLAGGPFTLRWGYEDPSLRVTDITVTEGNAGTVNAVFRVQLSGPSAQTVTVDASTVNGTAKAPADYTATSAALSFAPGELEKTVTVPVNGDTLYEVAEKFYLDLSSPVGATIADVRGIGTIRNDDAQPSVTIADFRRAEGTGTNPTFTFTVTQSTVTGAATKVQFATANGTAAAGSDYVAKTGTLTIPAGATSGNVSVTVTGDAAVEPDETFLVNLTSATNATIADNQATGSILNDD